jgi:hypothetical protein
MAMNNIGLLYYNGEGVEQSYETALEWFETAADLGIEIAKENAENTRELLQQENAVKFNTIFQSSSAKMGSFNF